MCLAEIFNQIRSLILFQYFAKIGVFIVRLDFQAISHPTHPEHCAMMDTLVCDGDDVYDG